MENRQNVDAIGAQNNIIMKSLEQKGPSESLNDISSFRIKNRERQRRYRARKRLEANVKKASVSPQDFQQDRDLINYNSIVHRKRNWKKDARKAHACKTLEAAGTSMMSAVALSSEIQTHCLAPVMGVEPALDRKSHSESSISFPSSGTKPEFGRRNWKAEARRNKN